MSLEKQKAFIIHCIFGFILLIMVYAGIKYVFPLLMPFVIGIVVAMAFRNVIDLLEEKTHIKRTIISIVVLISFYSLVGLIISLIGAKFFHFISTLFNSLPSLYKETLQPVFQMMTDNMFDRFPSIKIYMDDFINNIGQSIFTYLSNISTKVVGMVTGLASQVPTLLIKVIFTIVSSFFFTIDYYKISNFLIHQFRSEQRDVIIKIKDNIIGSLGKFIKAYALIISITFLELSLGFKLLSIPTPFLLGGIVAIIDIMPILGTGAVLLPWSIIAFSMGDTKTGLGMLVLYIFITVIRQILEPKIIGQQIGLHPIVTLILMFIGAQLMGILGLLILPVIATILVKLNREGSIHLFKT
ncbi:sporulation integral membrane protein YtvI [Clostridium sp. Marseille-P2415]|uniref:sporulation integral membrane protein YtvI n=1 Tax=Clostridium sp. Marseille-P2415 TaxID=1805471 RepID=UPI00098850E5|nr:sporulation integral membrane protein YtvI [Clostridium sp. Marseille-P2415]